MKKEQTKWKKQRGKESREARLRPEGKRKEEKKNREMGEGCELWGGKERKKKKIEMGEARGVGEKKKKKKFNLFIRWKV